MKTVSYYYSNYLSEYVECYCDTKAQYFITHFCKQSQKINYPITYQNIWSVTMIQKLNVL